MICNFRHQGENPPEVCPVCGAQKQSFQRDKGNNSLPTTANATHILVVGGGIAGLSAVENIRKTNPLAEITLLSSEPSLPYYRLNLTQYLAGALLKKDLYIHDAAWYSQQSINLITGIGVDQINSAQKSVELQDGREIPYDKLILTCGAHPFIPAFPGGYLEGVTSLRTLRDAETIMQAIEKKSEFVIIGGGILGLEAAGALAARKAKVTLLEGHGWLMPRQLCKKAGERLQEHMKSLGINIRLQAQTQAILGSSRAEAVQLQDGECIPAGLVIICTGVRSNSYLARQAGLNVGQGVVVDDQLRTSDPSIYAAGDTCEHRGMMYGNWMAAYAQGAVAGINAAGASAGFAQIPRAHTIKVLGINLFSIGQFEALDGSYQLVETDNANGYYRFIFRDERMVGCVLLGDTSAASRIKQAIEEQQLFPDIFQNKPSLTSLLERVG